MRLIGKLEENVEKADNKNQAKELIAKAGMALTDDEMQKVSGGDMKRPQSVTLENLDNYRVQCPACGEFSDQDNTVCPFCKTPLEKIQDYLPTNTTYRII